MPSVITLEGARGQLAAPSSGLSASDDNALVQWLHTQNPIVAVGVGLGLSIAFGFALTQAASWFLKKGQI